MRLTLPYFGFCYWLTHEIFLGSFGFRDHGPSHGFRAEVAADVGVRHILAINHATTDAIRIADRDAIIERHKKGVGVSVKKAHAFGHVSMTTIRMRR